MPPSPPRRAASADPPSPTVSVVIPALNEEHTLPLVLEGLPPVDEVIVVDGGSADDTVAVAREVRPDAIVVRQTRSGKGNALACGFAISHGDIVVTVNADGSTDPGELPRFVDALLSGAEVAHGSRFRHGGGQLDGRALDRLGNRLFSQFVNVFFGTRFTDLGYGYNAYWRTLLPTLDLPAPQVAGLRHGERLWGDGPEIEPLINIRMAAQGLRVVEVASVEYPPIHGSRDRDSLSRARRAMRTAMSEYVRRWRIGRDPRRPPAAVNSAPSAPTTPARPPGVEPRRARRGRAAGGVADVPPTPRHDEPPADRRQWRAHAGSEPSRGHRPDFDQAPGRHSIAAERRRGPRGYADRGLRGYADREPRSYADREPRGYADRGPRHFEPARERDPVPDQRRRTARDADERTWRIPDEPWRGAEDPWRGADDGYRTGQHQAVTDDDPPSPRAGRRPDLTVIAGDGGDSQQTRDVPARGERGRLPQQPRSRHLRAVPGELYGRPERG